MLLSGRARINAMKDKSFDEDDDAAAATVNRKKLSDVKVRSLGLCTPFDSADAVVDNFPLIITTA